MKFGYREVCLQHETGPRHPDSQARLRAVRRALSERHGVEYIAAPVAEREELARVHDDDYIDEFEAFCERGGGRWDEDTVASKRTWDAALASAGLARWAGEAALDGDDGRQTPFALCRPPGHHAVSDDAMGFCFLNNTAIAARSALANGADRVAVLDVDVHHGNGTQDLFYDDDRVFYVSVHEHGLFPDSGAIEETGTGAAEGTTLNVPLPPGSSHEAYLRTLSSLVSPALGSFDPDLVLVSAGFDIHEHDPISRTTVSTEGIGRVTEAIRALADDIGAALAFVLEGGYELDTLSESVRMVHEVFDGYRPEVENEPVDGDLTAVLDEVRAQGVRGL